MVKVQLHKLPSSELDFLIFGEESLVVNIVISGSQDEEDPIKSATYDVNDCVEIAGWGNYHWRVVSVMGMMSVADASEIWLTTIIIS